MGSYEYPTGYINQCNRAVMSHINLLIRELTSTGVGPRRDRQLLLPLKHGRYHEQSGARYVNKSW